MPTITQVINDLQNLTYSKVTQSDIARALGITRATISARVKTESQITQAERETLERVFNVDLTKVKQLDNDCVNLPVRGNLSASLGTGIDINDETQTATYTVSRKLMRYCGASLQETDFVPCEGDSMYPTIEGGALLMVDRSKTEIFDGKIYCVRLNNQLMAKRLQFLPPNKIKVISDNFEKYDPFYVDLSKELNFDFAIIGEVKWYGMVVR